jgi:hypothetical protein
MGSMGNRQSTEDWPQGSGRLEAGVAFTML